MKRVSIKRDIYIYLFGLVVSLSVIYGLMISQSYQVGLNESVKYGFLYELKIAENEFVTTGEIPKTKSNTLQIYKNLNEIPKKYIGIFDWFDFESNVIYEKYLTSDGKASGEYFYAIIYYIESRNEYIYAVSNYDESIYLELFKESPPESTNQFNSAFMAIGFLLLLVFVLIRSLIHKLVKPILLLAEWSEKLDLTDISKIQSIRYSEIQKLATELIKSVEKQREVIERETFFLQAASHELRTPVATISASYEMLSRLSFSMSESSQRAVGRIGRSVTTVQNLINTLLWMSRDQNSHFELSDVDLETMVLGILKHHRHLLNGKEVSVIVESTEIKSSKKLPAILVEVIATNLIRNALQHTKQGNIDILIAKDTIKVVNAYDRSENVSSEPSFGIGLMLAKRICENQHWQLDHYENNNEYISIIHYKKQSLA